MQKINRKWKDALDEFIRELKEKYTGNCSYYCMTRELQ